MKPKLWLTRTLVTCALSLVASSVFADARPNVVLIVTDDQGYGDMSCHGNPWLKTPNLDRLCAESVRLENYHVDPFSTPTRAALMTGRYSSRVGAWAVTQGRQLLKPDEVIMADTFSNSGYRTGMFGKWHLGDQWPYAPRFQLGANEENPTLLTVRDWHPTHGTVIWQQQQLGDDSLSINGFWAINVVEAGRYSIRLSRFPDDAPAAMRASKAVLRIGEQEFEKELDRSESSVTFEVVLPVGHSLLQSWLSDEETGTRGAYFVHVEGDAE